MSEIRRRAFPNTTAALKTYDASKLERARIWEKVETEQDIFAAERLEHDAVALVQEAYYQDTSDINSRDHCRRIAVEDMKRVVHNANIQAINDAEDSVGSAF